MAKTVVFDRYLYVVFPHLCTGCLMPEPHEEMHVVTGKLAGKSMAAKLAFRTGTLATGLFFGGFGAAALEMATGRHKYTTVIVPVCEKCLLSLTPAEQEQIKKGIIKDPGDFFIKAVQNRILCCKVKANTVHLTLEQDSIADALLALNEGVALEGGPPSTDGPKASEAVVVEVNINAQESPGTLGKIGGIERQKYVAMYQRQLSDLDILLIDRWRSLVGDQINIYTFPKIPERKLSNAREQYATLLPEDIVIGLQDSTVGGSAKEGAVFTTRFFIWKWAGKSGRLNYSDINTAKLEGKYRWPDSIIFHDGDKIQLNAGKKALQALVSFIAEASRIIKGN